ncbi:MAG: hypothetical protein JWM82_314 [Myxococcales bacterium]|nr:hypothetical protein [Myxococcales bacterium]
MHPSDCWRREEDGGGSRLGPMNRRARSIGTLLLSGATLVACGGGGDLVGGGSPTTSALRLCDGSAGVRLAARVGGGGPVGLGRYMRSENGFEFLLVTGTCEAWVLPDDAQPLRHLTLTSAQESALVTDLRVARWSALAMRTPPAGGCSDASSLTYRFDQAHYQSPGCGVDPTDELALVDRAFDVKLQELAAAGAPAAGDARYLVLEGDGSTAADLYYKNPAPWPLGVAPATVAVPRDQIFSQPTTGRSLRVSGDDARKLRALRADFLAGRIGNVMFEDYIPIVTTDSAYYELYIRDVSPFEGADGLIGPGIF